MAEASETAVSYTHLVDDLARADLLIYSIFGNAARSFKGPRLFYTEDVYKRQGHEQHGLLRSG